MKTWLRILLSIVLVGVIAFFLVYKFVYNKPHPDYQNIKPDYTLNAKDLYNAFHDHKDASTKTYNGKVVQIEGTLTRVEAKDSMAIVVFAFNQGMFGDEGIRCTMIKKLNDEAASLVPSGSVKIKGYCTGFNDTDVILEQCSVVF
jgi:hypothetical protein